MNNRQKSFADKLRKDESGISIPGVMIVLIVVAIVVVLALPQIISSRRLLRFSAVQKEMTTYLREARQLAMSERKQVTFRYDHANRRIILFGGRLGVAGDPKNRRLDLAGMGVAPDNIIYGRPPGASAAALGDGTDITSLTSNLVDIRFEPDGSVLDGSDNLENNALFIYHAIHPADTAFALSILGSGGRVKVWNYSAGVNAYLE